MHGDTVVAGEAAGAAMSGPGQPMERSPGHGGGCTDHRAAWIRSDRYDRRHPTRTSSHPLVALPRLRTGDAARTAGGRSEGVRVLGKGGLLPADLRLPLLSAAHARDGEEPRSLVLQQGNV